MPGIDNPNVIDLIADSPELNEVKLIIVETRTWDGSKQEEDRLLEKIDSYLSFVEGGQMARMYPQFAGRNFHIQVDCIVPPPPKVRGIIFQVNEQLTQFKNIKVSWHQLQ